MPDTVSTAASEHAAQIDQKVFGASVVVVSTPRRDREESFISDGYRARTILREERGNIALSRKLPITDGYRVTKDSVIGASGSVVSPKVDRSVGAAATLADV